MHFNLNSNEDTIHHHLA